MLDTSEIKIPIDFLCPISREIMEDPVIAADGQSYEREKIEKWLINNSTSSLTGAQLEHKNLTPNHRLKAFIKDYMPQIKKERKMFADMKATIATMEKLICELRSKQCTQEQKIREQEQKIEEQEQKYEIERQENLRLQTKQMQTSLSAQPNSNTIPPKIFFFASPADTPEDLCKKGMSLEQKIGENGDEYKEDEYGARHLYAIAANKGYVPALYYLARRFECATGSEKDIEKAAGLYYLAAEKGYAPAQLDLGGCYRSGSGVEKDRAEAVKWYRLAAKQGNEMAQYNLNRELSR